MQRLSIFQKCTSKRDRQRTKENEDKKSTNARNDRTIYSTLMTGSHDSSFEGTDQEM
jgi:hypothetical protein